MDILHFPGYTFTIKENTSTGKLGTSYNQLVIFLPAGKEEKVDETFDSLYNDTYDCMYRSRG